MRYLNLVLGLLLWMSATACESIATAPTVAKSATGGGSLAFRQAAAAEWSFRGTLRATEKVTGTAHHLDGSGNGTHLGKFDYTADIVVDEITEDGAGMVTWEAANGDQLTGTTAGQIVSFEFPMIGIRETQTITGGTGRFDGASGTIIVDRIFDFEAGTTTGSFSGVIQIGH